MIACWAMGLTQHRFGVGNVQEVMNLLLLRGNIGKPGAGPCPVRGHSNVQGDRTMGIWERPRPALPRRARRASSASTPPRQPGFSTVEAIEAMARGPRARRSSRSAGTSRWRRPTRRCAEAALARCRLTVHVATKLNRTHLLGARGRSLLPCLGRTERDVQARRARSS